MTTLQTPGAAGAPPAAPASGHNSTGGMLHGEGSNPPVEIINCATCKGHGVVITTQDYWGNWEDAPCYECHGTGITFIPLLELSIGCRYCHRELYDQQEVDWGICTGCHDDGVLEMRASA